jgi:hypothetical protein
VYAITIVVAVDSNQLERFRYQEKPCKHGINAMIIQPAGRSFDIPRCECAMKERGKFPKR